MKQTSIPKKLSSDDPGGSDVDIMSTDYYSSIAILGATGRLGQRIVKSLSEHSLSSSLSIRILTRPGRSAFAAEKLKDEYFPNFLKVSVYEIDYERAAKEKPLRDALRGVQVVVSAISDASEVEKRRSGEAKSLEELPGFKAQVAVAKIAKEVGVSLFVPSEYGYPTHTIPSDSAMFLVGKKHFLDYLRKIDLPWLIVYAGTFAQREPDPTPLLPCTPETPMGAPPFRTTRYHVASYIAHLLLDVLPEATTWGIFRILGVRRDELVEIEDGGERWVVHEG